MSWHQIASFVTVFVNAIVQSCKSVRGIARIPNIPLYFEHFLFYVLNFEFLQIHSTQSNKV